MLLADTEGPNTNVGGGGGGAAGRRAAFGSAFQSALNMLASILKTCHEGHQHALGLAYGYCCGSVLVSAHDQQQQQQQQHFFSSSSAAPAPAPARQQSPAAAAASFALFPNSISPLPPAAVATAAGVGGGGGGAASASSSSSPPYIPPPAPSEAQMRCYRRFRDVHFAEWWWPNQCGSNSGGSNGQGGSTVAAFAPLNEAFAAASAVDASGSDDGGAALAALRRAHSQAAADASAAANGSSTDSNSTVGATSTTAKTSANNGGSGLWVSATRHYAPNDFPSALLHICLVRATSEERGGNMYALQPVIFSLCCLFPEALGRVEAAFAAIYARRAVDVFAEVVPSAGGNNQQQQQQHQQQQHANYLNPNQYGGNGGCGGYGQHQQQQQHYHQEGHGVAAAPLPPSASAVARQKVATVFKLLTHQLAPPCPAHGGDEYSPDPALRAYFARHLPVQQTAAVAGAAGGHFRSPHSHQYGEESSGGGAALCLCDLPVAAWLPVMAPEKRRRERFNQNLTLFCEAMKAF